MAQIVVTAETVRIELTRREKVAALRRRDVVVRRAHVAAARVSERPFAELRGLRVPGAGFPGVIAVGTWRHRRGADFVAVHRGERALVVDLTEEAPYRRLVISSEDPERTLAELG